MAKITLKKVECIRQVDLTGKDEPVVYIASQQVWEDKMNKGGIQWPGVSRTFHDSVLVELKEKSGNKYKSLGSWTITESDAPETTRTATSSGYDYEVTWMVDAAA
jgi:hypothetical protein